MRMLVVNNNGGSNNINNFDGESETNDAREF